MASTKASTSRSGSTGGTKKKSTSSASRSSTTQKKTTSSRSTSSGKGKGSGSSARRTTSSRSSAAKRRNTKQVQPIRREVGALICLLLAIFAGLGYFNIKAIFITFFTNLLKGLFGYGFWFVPPMLLVCAGILFFHRGRPVKRRVICALLVPVFLSNLIHLLAVPGEFGLTKIPDLWKAGLELKSGGVISGWFSILFSTIFSRIGAAILFLLALFFCNMTITKITPVDIWDGIVSAVSALRDYIRSRPEYEEEPDYFGSDEDEPQQAPSALSRVKKHRKGTPVPEHEITQVETEGAPAVRRRSRRSDIDIPLDDEPAVPDSESGRSYFDNKPTARPPHEILEAQSAAEAAPPTPEKREVFSPLEPLEVAPAAVPAAKPVEAAAKPAESSAVVKLKPVERKAEGETPAPPVSDQQRRSDAAIAAEKVRRQVDTQTYQYPSVDLLDKGRGVSNADANAELQQTRELLDDTIQSFGIDARIINVTRGPSVTRFELELMRGVKLNKLTGISDDIALALGAASVRIAPITGRNSVVGIEIPNQLVTPVPIREVIDSKEFRTHVSKVAFAVGKDISGKNVVGNIAKLPHMLIAGTTGSGKSVCTNSLIISLLYKSSPEDVRLIMVDPKMVELGIYNGIPHLLIPVVTDPKKAAGALQWAVTEMMKRYRAFSELGVRDLASYNAHMLQNGEEKLPQIVVVIDELADLMLVAAKEVEESICRVAQMGRAAGMHLVIATQRPSSDVITGLMKANIPSRIAFAVASSLESRIILDSVGAEKLVGKGDMLYAPLGIGKPQRVQGCMISDEEVARVVEFIKQNSVENYDDSVMEEVESSAQSVGTKNGKGASAQSESAGNKASTEDSASEMDELLPQAVEVVVETGMASVSMLQRRLKLGYSRAARLVDQMEERKIVGPFEGSKPRQVLVTKEQWAAQKEQFLGSGAPQESVIQADEFAAALAMSEAADAAEAAGDALDIGEEPPF